MNIRDEIVAKRRTRIRGEGHNLGVPVPTLRQSPLVPFSAHPGLICEIKRRSPSKGEISPGLDPVRQASLYVKSGIVTISVLTEEDHFAGSLKDLLRIKQAYPKLAVLRKDFLLDIEDVEVSYRAGADAVLLIASVLDPSSLRAMHERAVSLGMAALVEVHDEEDIEKVRAVAPPLVGINSRNLETFTIDPVRPIALKSALDWRPRLVYESGIGREEDARLASASGFEYLLVGEAVVRRPELIGEILKGKALGGNRFWADLFARCRTYLPALGEGPTEALTDGGEATGCSKRPLVKICGLTSSEDVHAAVEAGADALGFIFARSPRRADAALVRSMGGRHPDEPVRVGVIISDDPTDPGRDALELLDEGFLDAIQFHGNETSAECYKKAFPYYKAMNLASAGHAAGIKDFRSPRVLVDAHVAGKGGGTGVRVPEDILEEAARVKPLWLAGGLNPENIASVVRRHGPELVDVSSGVESAPGRKNHEKLRCFIQQARTLM